jgi:ABC-type sugar transport system permease subunit
MVFFLVGLKGIDSTYYEVSDIDGANAFQKFWRITWPLLKPTTVMVIITSFINAIRDFTVPFIMLQGGPAGSTTSLSILIYLNGFDFLKMGKASAISTLMFIVIMVITLIQLRVFRTEE